MGASQGVSPTLTNRAQDLGDGSTGPTNGALSVARLDPTLGQGRAVRPPEQEFLDGGEERSCSDRVRSAARTLEVVEFAADFCAERVVASTERIRSSGVSLSVDDFGQAVSSLARLNLFDVDELKIDRRFVSRMINHGRDVAIVDLVVALADRLGLRLVAEGVERVPRVERSTPMAQPAAALSDAC